MARKEALQLRRDTRSLILAFVFPVFLVLVFGAAISMDVRDIAFVVLDRDGTPASRELVDAFRSSGYFRYQGAIDRPAEADPLLRQAQVRMVLVIPPDYQRDLGTSRGFPIRCPRGLPDEGFPRRGLALDSVGISWQLQTHRARAGYTTHFKNSPR